LGSGGDRRDGVAGAGGASGLGDGGELRQAGQGGEAAKRKEAGVFGEFKLLVEGWILDQQNRLFIPSGWFHPE